jgi:hypothetical protein
MRWPLAGEGKDQMAPATKRYLLLSALSGGVWGVVAYVLGSTFLSLLARAADE